MKVNKTKIKKEKLNSKNKNLGHLNIGELFNNSNNIKNNENKNKKKINITIGKENKKLATHLCESNEKTEKNPVYLKENHMKDNNNFADSYKNIINSPRPNKFKDYTQCKKLVSLHYIKNTSNPKYETKTHKLQENKEQKKEYRIETIFSYPVKYINNNINFNNYFISEKINPSSIRSYKTLSKRSPFSKEKLKANNKNKKLINKNIKRKIMDNKNNDTKLNHKYNKNKNKKEINLNKILKNESFNKKFAKNDTEIKYINNDNEDINESNDKDIIKKYEKEKIFNTNDDIDKYFKFVDSLDNEEEYDFSIDYKKALKSGNFNQNKVKIFDDELSSISSEPHKKYISQKPKNKIQSPIKIEIKQENKKLKDLKSIHKNNYNKNKEIFKKFQKTKTKENEFNRLLYNKTFKKFLNNKLKYYMEEEDIPKQFINSLKISHDKKEFHQRHINKFKNKKYDNYFTDNYHNENIPNLNKNYESLENDNLRKEKEIKNLKEKLNNQNIIINEKKEIINELQNINQNLKKEVKELKNKYYNKENKLNDIKVNDEEKNYNQYKKNKIINNYEYKFYDKNKEKDKKYDNLSYEELMERKNKLIKIRKETNDEYFKIVNKMKNNNYIIFLEKKLNNINRSLIELRKNLKKFEK